jgi:Cu/Ag efflux protein CusF
VFIAGAAASCGDSSTPPATGERRYSLEGQILSLSPGGTEASIKHGDIPGFMSAMTMTYKVRDAKEFADLKPGDLITATVVVTTSEGYLTEVKKVGEAPVEQPAQQPPPVGSTFELQQPGSAAT